MDVYGFSTLHFYDIGDASEHFQSHDNFMTLRPGTKGKFDYEKRICILGSSFVSQSSSLSGWGYAASNEIDGFLITIPHSGFVQWRTYNRMHRTERSAVALVDQREVQEGDYAPGASYTTVYISFADILKHLTVMLGYPPRTRIFFQRKTAGAWQVQFIQKLAETIIDLATHSPIPIKSVADSLKESLIGFVLCNFQNNYTAAIFDPNNSLTPTPHSINRAADYMATSTDPHLTVCEVAVHAGLSVRSLQMGFKRFKKTTPIIFLREQRLHKAKCMLNTDENNLSPREIAYACGFSNYQTFCKYYASKYFQHPSSIRSGSQRKTET